MKKMLGGIVSVALLVGGVWFASENFFNQGFDSGNGSEGNRKSLDLNITGEGFGVIEMDGNNVGRHTEGTYMYPEGTDIKVSGSAAPGWFVDKIIPKKNFTMNSDHSVEIVFKRYI